MSQEDYLGPQRGRTDLGALAYEYPKPTREYRTLPLTPQFKDESPAGNQHLRYDTPATTPRRRPQMWDLVPIVDGGGTYECYAPYIIASRASLGAKLTITGNSFTPAVGKFVVVNMDFTGLAEIALFTSDGTDPVYTWVGDVLDEARIPLWQFVAPETAGAIAVTETVWAIRLVGTGALRSMRTTALVESSTQLASALDLI